MNFDLNQLAALLNSFGPWGVVAAVALTAFGPKILDAIRKRLPNLKFPPASPAGPTPAPGPDPGPLVNPGPLADRPVLNLPVLNLLLASLRQLLAARNPGADPDQLVIRHLASQLGVEATGIGLDRELIEKK